jgi:hypothetical protein
VLDGRRRRCLRRGGWRGRSARLPRRTARHARGPLASRRLDHAGLERSLRHALDAARRAAHSSADGKLKPVGAPDDVRTDACAICVADADAVAGAQPAADPAAHAAPDARAGKSYGGTGLRADSKTNASAVLGADGEAYTPPVAAADATTFARANAAADATPVAGANALSDHAGAVNSADDVASTISSTDDAGALRRTDARTDACADSRAYA